MNWKQRIFAGLAISLSVTMPVLLSPPDLKIVIGIAYGVVALIVLAVIGAVEFYLWLGNH